MNGSQSRPKEDRNLDQTPELMHELSTLSFLYRSPLGKGTGGSRTTSMDDTFHPDNGNWAAIR